MTNEELIMQAWSEGVKFAIREMAKHPVAFCTDSMVEITAKLIVDAAVKEKVVLAQTLGLPA